MDSSENMFTSYQVRPHAYKTKICVFYLNRGRCMRGDSCNFVHSNEQSAPILKDVTSKSICRQRSNSGVEEAFNSNDNHINLFLKTLYEKARFKRISIRQYSKVLLNPNSKGLAITSSKDEIPMFSGTLEYKSKILSVFYELNETSQKGRFSLTLEEYDHDTIIKKFLIGIPVNGTICEKPYGYSTNYTWMSDTTHCKRKHKSVETLIQEAFKECILSINPTPDGYIVSADISKNPEKTYKLVYMHKHIEYQNKDFLDE